MFKINQVIETGEDYPVQCLLKDLYCDFKQDNRSIIKAEYFYAAKE
jgi:hypothetical protein